MDQVDSDLIALGDWKDSLNYIKVKDTWEDWLIPGRWNVSDTIAIQSVLLNLVGRTFDQAADLAEAKGEYSKAFIWQDRAKTNRGRFSRFWDQEKTFYTYFGDVSGYLWGDTLGGGPAGVPWLQTAWIGHINDELMRRATRLYYDNYLKGYGGTVFAWTKSNWMYGKVEMDPNVRLDCVFWCPFAAAAYLGIDDIVEDCISRLKGIYSNTDLGLFEEHPTWDGQPSSHYHMIRTMGIFLMGFAYAFGPRRDPAEVKKFLLKLHTSGKEVLILKQTGTSKDQFGNIIPSHEPAYNAEAVVEGLGEQFRRDEQVVALPGFAAADECVFYFKAFTPVDLGDRIRVDNIDYAVQTVRKRYYRDRIVKKTVFAKKVIE